MLIRSLLCQFNFLTILPGGLIKFHRLPSSQSPPHPAVAEARCPNSPSAEKFIYEHFLRAERPWCFHLLDLLFQTLPVSYSGLDRRIDWGLLQDLKSLVQVLNNLFVWKPIAGSQMFDDISDRGRHLILRNVCSGRGLYGRVYYAYAQAYFLE